MSEEKNEREVTSSNVSRRDFLAGTAIGALGVASAGFLSGCSSNTGGQSSSTAGLSSATGAETPSAGTNSGESAEPIVPVEAPQEWTQEADVVIVGSGGAGLNAAILASEAGQSVLVLEKSSWLGGASQETTYLAIKGYRLNPFKDEEEKAAYLASLMPPTRVIDKSFITTLVDKSIECVDWMMDIGVKLTYAAGLTVPTNSIGDASLGISFANNSNFARAMMQVTEYLTDYARSNGVEFRPLTEVTTLVKDGDKIVGVQAKDKESGDTLYFKGSNGVVLASGGMTNNRELLKKYIPTSYTGAAATCMMPEHTGEGIRMGIGAGAGMRGFDTYKTYDGGLDYYANDVGPFYSYMFKGDNALVRQPWLKVNNNCQRYMATGMSKTNQAESCMDMSQPGHRAYVVFDNNYEDNIFNKLQPDGSIKPLTPTLDNLDRLPEGVCSHDWHVDVQEALDKGLIKKADTISELASELELDPAKLQLAVDEWNECCEKGEDPFWGQDPKYLLPISQPPYYGAKVGAWIWHSSCGLLVNNDMQVLDDKSQVIEGLYAAGMALGGDKGEGDAMFTGPLAGMAYAFTTGYIAGQTLATK